MTQAQQSLLGDAPLDVGDAADFWPTPEYAIEAIVPVLQARLDLRGSPLVNLLDPGCGDGVILDVVSRLVGTCTRIGIELHPGRAAQARQRTGARIELYDFLDDSVPRMHGGSIVGHGDRPVLVVMNPPFSKPRQSIGLEFFEQALRCAEPSRGIVAGLAPLDYACGKARVERLHNTHPCGLYPLKNRPKFANGQTGKRPVACFVKQLGANVRDRNDAGFDGEDGDAWDLGERLFDAIEHDPDGVRNDYQGAPVRVRLHSKKGGDPAEWPEDLRVREFPEARP